MRFDLADLSLFRHVVEAGSITAGAGAGASCAGGSLDPDSQHGGGARRAAAASRSRQGVTPTPAGRTLLQHARVMLAQAQRLHDDLSAYAGGLAGQVKVLSNTNALTEFLPER
jgi:DNA-binding transcriptional LysR family regulator